MMPFVPGSVGRGGGAAGAVTTLNPADKSASVTLTNGNLTAQTAGASGGARTIKSITAGDVFFEYTFNAVSNVQGIGFTTATRAFANGPYASFSWANATTARLIANFTAGSNFSVAAGVGDTIGLRFNFSTGLFSAYDKTGALVATISAPITDPVFAGFNLADSQRGTFNFGASAFVGGLPSGAVSFNDAT